MTHTYAILEISKPAFDEIKKKLMEGGYQDQFHEDDGRTVIDMHGIAVAVKGAPKTNRRMATLGPNYHPNAQVPVRIIARVENKPGDFFKCQTEGGEVLEIHRQNLALIDENG